MKTITAATECVSPQVYDEAFVYSDSTSALDATDAFFPTDKQIKDLNIKF